MYDQKYPFFNQIFTKLRNEFCKDFNAVQYLSYTIKKSWKFLANGGSDSALSMIVTTSRLLIASIIIC